MFFKTFGWSLTVTAVALAGALFLGGPEAFVLVAILCVLEISLSFDNAVVNATVLERMDEAWRRLFLTVGILIAVFGMRLLFPLLLVGVTAQLNPVEAVRLALAGGSVDEPGTYAALLHEAHPMIAAFGGAFLLMLFLDFIFEDRAVTWLSWLERPLGRIGKLDQLAVVVALGCLIVVAQALAEEPGTVMIAGSLGIVTYVLVNALGELFESEGTEDDSELAGIHGDAVNVQASLDAAAPARGRGNTVKIVTGKAAFFLFLYLEVLDASFSFDGVIGAFAITQDIFIIAVGLGVGAMYIRSITIYLVRKGTLAEYVYLEHGAHWAIGALATILLISIRHEVPEIITGLIGVAFITAALISSLVRNRRGGLAAAAEERREMLVGSR
ncbi:DUF475 domain-containing protein [Spirilliplanes yamanashiensis]|uniref:DUF475 domain-containing protein n=1 Tax=Spirilliplanes yamanashiensis TaxID=42233 RepID=A0A8J3Y877_9ACTN|nr:DUF475 domain-containing protein [Spirilliplanes yamanashiensis]MDP9817217.1 hypothetical protein [Spirilliplanes yamanashiensis]GIJ03129.1 hypothetical protein Sya03_24810 [Spirilliplanes yamanashiensis]